MKIKVAAEKVKQVLENLRDKPSLNSISYFVKLFKASISDEMHTEEENQDAGVVGKQKIFVEDGKLVESVVRFSLTEFPLLLK